MKFSDGFWLNKKGYDVNFVAQAYEVLEDSNSLTVLATATHIHHRGQTRRTIA